MQYKNDLWRVGYSFKKKKKTYDAMVEVLGAEVSIGKVASGSR